MKTFKKYIIKITQLQLVMLALLSFSSCGDGACEYDKPDTCEFEATNTELTGFSVVTCYAANPGDPVGVIYDTSMNAAAPLGDDWGVALTAATPSKAIHPASWTAANIGQVFGIAIDDDKNIYLAASHIYAQGVSPTPAQNAIPAQVYKCSGPTWNAVPWVALPNTGTGNLNGIGNIAFDKKNKQLFVSNLEDGKIYRYNTAGQFQDTYDPWLADISSAGIVGLSEQVWGVGVNYEAGATKVYFGRLRGAVREMYSVTLNADGSFPTTPQVTEFTNIPGTQASLSDIAFSSDTNEMLISERGFPHEAIVMSYTRTGTTWSFNKQYFVGGKVSSALPGENAAGGVDFAYKEVGGDVSAVCDDFFWATGNYMNVRNLASSDRVYGIEGISYAGNNAASAPITTANQDTDLFIDLNGTYSVSDKGGIGDVEVFDANVCFDICD